MKYRWRTDLNWLCGVSASQWAQLLRDNRVHSTYLHRVALISALSVYNSAMARLDGLTTREDLDAVEVRRPLFILGHWRSGTTWLYHLLASDPRLAAPNAFQTVNPRTFLGTEALSSRVFGFLIPERRVQDDVPLGFHTPEEDEYAIGLLSGCSVYLGRSFPDRLAHYERFLTLRDCSAEERSAFKGALREFASRLTLRYRRPLVLKSPAHTARVRLLLELFPDARFLHIHRHPYDVFRSTRHLYDTIDWFWTLQRRDADQDAVILRQYRDLHAAWFEDRDQIPEGHLMELAYDDLVADPLGALRRVYDGLDLGDFATAEPALRTELSRQPQYRTNHFAALSAAEKSAVREAAQPCFEAWGYAA